MTMSKSARLGNREWRTIFRVIGECRDLGDDRIKWREHWLTELARLTGAVYGAAGEIAECRALKPKDLGVTTWGWQDRSVDPTAVEAQLNEFRRNPAHSPTIIYCLRRNSIEEGVCQSRKHLLADREWYRSPEYQVIARAFGCDHNLLCFRQVPGAGPDECAGTLLSRAEGDGDFAPRDLALVREATRAITPLIGGPLARFADVSPLDLPPRARQVLACLLEGDGDKQIAARLSLSTYTVTQYTNVIYKHFGVMSRSELLARWLRRGRGGRFPWAD
jgi:DNA-binding CsgD family transcriptional regulator